MMRFCEQAEICIETGGGYVNHAKFILRGDDDKHDYTKTTQCLFRDLKIDLDIPQLASIPSDVWPLARSEAGS